MKTKNTKISLSSSTKGMMETDQTKRRILQGAKDEFLRQGYTGASMDRIASSLGMSKRTIYQVFPSKEALFREVMDSFIASTLELVGGLVNDGSLDFEEKLQRLMETVGSQLTRICQPLVADMRVRFPDIWKKVHAMRVRVIDEYWGEADERGAAPRRLP